MNKYVTAIGVLLTLAGIVYPIFPIGLYVINSTSVSNISVSCDNQNSCVASATVTNVNGTSPLYVWFMIRNYINQVVQLFQMKANIPQGSSQNIQTPVFVLRAGAYTMEVSITDLNNYPISKSYSYSFTTGSLYLDASYGNRSGISVVYVKPYPLFKDSYGDFYYKPGTQINVTEKLLSTPQQNPSQVLSCIQINDAATNNVITSSGSCPQTRSVTDPLGYKESVIFTINTNVYLSDNFAWTTSGYYINVKITVVSGQGTVNPSTAKLYQYSSSGPTSQTFTFTPASGYYLDHWDLRDTSLRLCKSGKSTTATITFNDAYTCNGNTYLDVFLNVYFSQTPTLTIGADTGVTTNPAVGTYTEQPNTMVTVKLVSVQNGYCFMGWDVNGKPSGNYSAITINMTQSYGVYAHAKQCISTTQTTTSGTTTVTSTTQRLPFIPSSFQISGLSILGIIVAVIGLVMKERD